MIGLDTNVLVRHFTQDDARQSAAATKLIRTECTNEEPGFISLVVLAELVWVLERAYRYDRPQIEQLIRRILTVDDFAVENSELAWRALNEFQNGTADFADYLIGLAGAVAKAEATCTFDARTAKSSLFRLVKA